MTRGYRKNRKPYLPSFAEQVADSQSRGDQVLWRVATTASKLAKTSCGRNREALYRIKHRAIHQMIDRGRIIVGVDHERFPGLLSVRSTQDPRMCLHTHENWLGIGWRTRA